jgi:hypothetical protein
MKSFGDNFGVQDKVDVVFSQIAKPLKRMQQSQGLAEGNRTFGREVDSFGQHKGALIIADTYTNTCPIQRVRERGINITLQPTRRRTLPNRVGPDG